MERTWLFGATNTTTLPNCLRCSHHGRIGCTQKNTKRIQKEWEYKKNELAKNLPTKVMPHIYIIVSGEPLWQLWGDSFPSNKYLCNLITLSIVFLYFFFLQRQVQNDEETNIKVQIGRLPSHRIWSFLFQQGSGLCQKLQKQEQLPPQPCCLLWCSKSCNNPFLLL